jgi:hypothetical protein
VREQFYSGDIHQRRPGLRGPLPPSREVIVADPRIGVIRGVQPAASIRLAPTKKDG